MWKRKVSAVIAVAGAVAAADGRPGEAFLSLTWTDTGDNDGQVEPGESAIITLSSLQIWDGQGHRYVAFGYAQIDVTTDDGDADVNGHTILNGLADIGGDWAEENGGNLDNAAFFQPTFRYVTDNPIALVRFRVDFTDFDARTVTYATSLEDSLGKILVIANANGDLVNENYTGYDASMGITIMPSPAGLALLCMGGLVIPRRSREPSDVEHLLVA